MSQPKDEPTLLVASAAVLVAALTGLLVWSGDRAVDETAADDLVPTVARAATAAPTGVAQDVPSSGDRAPAAVTAPPTGAMRADEGAPEEDPSKGAEQAPSALADASSGEGVKDLCRRIGDKLGSVSAADCERVAFRFDGQRSVLGAPLVAADFEPTGAARGRVLLLGGIHGDEYSSVSIVFRWLEALADDRTLGELHWRIIPLLNPDGLLRARSQRMNERGVDLNRNFPTQDWDELATDYWVRRTGRNPRRYPGPEPLSEPESRYLHSQIQHYAPDLIVAVHAPLEVVDFDGPPDPPARLGSLYLHRMGTYPGSLGRYGGEQLGLPVVTIELSSAGIMPAPAEVRRIWRDLVDYAQRTLAFEGDALVAVEPTAGANLR